VLSVCQFRASTSLRAENQPRLYDWTDAGNWDTAKPIMAKPHQEQQEQKLDPAPPPPAARIDRPAHTPLIFLLFFFLLAGWILSSPQHTSVELPVEASPSVSPIPQIKPDANMSSTEQT
jgi:hypothetical protein